MLHQAYRKKDEAPQDDYRYEFPGQPVQELVPDEVKQIQPALRLETRVMALLIC